MSKLCIQRLRVICMKKTEIINALGQEDFTEFYQNADKIKKENFGDNIYIRAILEFSNYCRRCCDYCGINASNHNIKRYRIIPEEIIKTAVTAYEYGYKTIVLQSGEDNYYNTEILSYILSEIKKCGIFITLSCGERTDYDILKKSGADRYLIKHETSDRKIYEALHPESSFDNRISCIKTLKRLKFETGSGFMIGLPGQTLETIADDILLLKELGCDMAGIGPFIPHPDTRLKSTEKGSSELTKRAVALSRIIMPKINLPATTSLGVVNEKAKNDVFSCGANVIMKKVTPTEYKRFYEIYPSEMNDTDILKDRLLLEEQIKALGCVPV